MPVDPAGFCKVKFVYSDAVGELFPGMEGKLVGSPAVADLQALADFIGGEWADGWAAGTNPLLTLKELRLIYSNGTIEEQVVSAVNVVGTLGSVTSVPRSACCVTGYSIASFYRGGKPRTYWPYVGRYAPSSTTHWATGIAAQYAINVTELMEDLAGFSHTGITSFTLGCIRRRRLGSAIVPPEFYPYTAAHGDDRICSQRKRLGAL